MEILGEEKIGVNSFHHQAVREIPENAKEAAVSEDGLIEALEFGGEEGVFGRGAVQQDRAAVGHLRPRY